MSPEMSGLWTALGAGLVGGTPGVILAAIFARKDRVRDRRYERADAAYQQLVSAMVTVVDLVASIDTRAATWPGAEVAADWNDCLRVMRAAMVNVVKIGPTDVVDAAKLFCTMVEHEVMVRTLPRQVIAPGHLVPLDYVEPIPPDFPLMLLMCPPRDQEQFDPWRTTSGGVLDEVALLAEKALDRRFRSASG